MIEVEVRIASQFDLQQVIDALDLDADALASHTLERTPVLATLHGPADEVGAFLRGSSMFRARFAPSEGGVSRGVIEAI